MKISMLAAVPIALTLSAGVAMADDVRMKDLPAPVRATIEREAKGAAIEDVDREVRSGSVYYEVEIERDNQEWTLHIDERGRVIARERDT